MNQSKISVRYAKALFILAKEKGILDEVYLNINVLANIVDKSEDFATVFSNPTILQSEKKSIIIKVFADFNQMIIDFICLLIDNNRQNHLKTIILNFCDLYRKEKNILKITTTTAEELGEKSREALNDLFKKHYNKSIELEERINQNIIGGIVLRIDNYELNMSVANQLAEIKSSLKSEVYKKKV